MAGTLTHKPVRPSSPSPTPAQAAAARRVAGPLLALAAWLALVWIAHQWGERLLAGGQRIQVGFPPLVGRLDPRLGLSALPALILAGAAVLGAPALAARLPWHRLLVATMVAAAAWAVCLALVDGPGGLTRPLLLRGEYLHDVARVGSPSDFLRGFTGRLATYHTHTQGHPPGMLLLLWALHRVGLGGPGWAAALCITGGAAAAPAVLVAVRAVTGDEAPARRAAPFLAFAPAAVWVATTADAFYAGLGAWGVALLALAFSGQRGGLQIPRFAREQNARSGRHRVSAVSVDPPPACGERRADLPAAAGGLLLGVGVYFSYGLVLLAPVVAGLTVASFRRPARWRPLVVAAVAAGVVAVAFTAAGFWWFDGLAATRSAYFAGVASRRPYGYFLLANLAAFALATGPAAGVALARLQTGRLSQLATFFRVWRGKTWPVRRQRDPGSAGPWLLAGGALAAVAVADVSGLSRGEVERIWLPFVPWVLVATSALRGRGWLGLQVAAGLAVQLVVRTPW